MSDMSRSEAISILKKLKLDAEDYGKESDFVKQAVEAFDTAISSLETDEAYNLMYEQPEFCEDCISRKNILESLNGAFPSTDWNKALFRKIVMDSPSVLPKATKNDCETCIHNKGVLECDMYGCKYEPTTKENLAVDVPDNNVGNIDCISRADAIGSIAVECSAEKLDIDYAKFLMLRRAIKALPTVTPIRPKGHWIVEKGGSYLGKRNACCSNCKDFYSSDWNVFNYCPNCGAKMESEE